MSENTNTISRRDALKRSLFGGLFAAGIPITETIKQQNAAIAAATGTGENIPAFGYKQPHSQKPGAIAVTFGLVSGSRYLPVRPQGAVIPDGKLVYFLWPSERGQARVYADFDHAKDLDPALFVFRLREGELQAPYYLHWRSGNYSLYTCPGSLMHRACKLIRDNNPDSTLQALSDIRQAVLLNLTICGDGQAIINRMSELDREIRSSAPDANIFPLWDEYRALLTATNPNKSEAA